MLGCEYVPDPVDHAGALELLHTLVRSISIHSNTQTPLIENNSIYFSDLLECFIKNIV